MRHCGLSVLLGLMCMFLSNSAWAGPALVLAKPRTITARLSAFAQVAPIVLTRVRATDNGILASLRVLPGQPVRAGAALGRLRELDDGVVLVGGAALRGERAALEMGSDFWTGRDARDVVALVERLAAQGRRRRS